MKNKNELLRLRTLIENDRINMGDNFIELIVSDLSNLLKDYFDFGGVPELFIEKQNGKYKINVILYATRIKNFASIPKN